MKINHSPIGVIGAGAWGTALSCLLLEKNRHVKLWAYEDQTAQNINQYRENKVFLPGVAIPDGIQAFSEIKQVVADCETLVVASQVQKTRSLIREFKTVLTSNHQFVLAGKGIERESGSLLHEIFEEELGTSGNDSILSGPTFAMEVAKEKTNSSRYCISQS